MLDNLADLKITFQITNQDMCVEINSSQLKLGNEIFFSREVKHDTKY